MYYNLCTITSGKREQLVFYGAMTISGMTLSIITLVIITIKYSDLIVTRGRTFFTVWSGIMLSVDVLMLILLNVVRSSVVMLNTVILSSWISLCWVSLCLVTLCWVCLWWESLHWVWMCLMSSRTVITLSVVSPFLQLFRDLNASHDWNEIESQFFTIFTNSRKH